MRFGCFGRLVAWKGIDLLLEAFAAVAARVPARLEILGDGPLRAGLEEAAGRLGVADRVEFTGWIDQARVPRPAGGTGRFVLPSLLECGGAVVLEAMAVGLPVIATDWGGPADYLDASCGILVKPTGRAEFCSGLAAAMLELAESPDRRRALGGAGRLRVSRDFDWQIKVDQMLAIYRDTVARATGEGSGDRGQGSGRRVRRIGIPPLGGLWNLARATHPNRPLAADP